MTPPSCHGTEALAESWVSMALSDEPARTSILSEQEIAAMRRERDILALRIRQSQETIEHSKELLRRLDQILAASGG